MERIVVVGNSGSGKTTVARALATRLGLAHLELDSIYHQQGWEPLPQDEFVARTTEFVDMAPHGWVADGNYSTLQPLLVERADTVVWLDLARWRVMVQLTGRTLRRMITREELWNGNREEFRNLLSRDPKQSILLWAWTRHGLYHERYLARSTSADWAHIEVIRLRSADQIDRLVADPGSRPC